MPEKKITPDEPHLATARKWRPQLFADIVGQSHITTTLRNAVASGRLGHAYLFSGPRGVGKTTTARILAKAINCLHPKNSDPDNECEICTEITEGRSVNVFEIDGASNRGVDEIRNLREAVRYGPGTGKYKVYIIDEVHMLTKEAFNALLKTLEEPPPYIVFMFATTEVHKVPATILSRCQRFEFRRISAAEIVSSIAAIAKKEKVDIDDATLDLVARRADGSLRDAQSIFDQVVSYCGPKVAVAEVRSLLKIVDDEFYFRVSDAVASRDSGAGFQIVEEVASSGFDLREFTGGLAEHFRNLLVVRSTGDTALVDGSEKLRERYAVSAKKFTESDLLRLMKLASDTEAAMRWSQQPKLKLELGLQLMVSLTPGVQIDQLIAGIEEIKKKVESGATGRQAPQSAPQPVPQSPPVTQVAQRSPAASMRPTGQAIPPPPAARPVESRETALAANSPAPVRGTVKATQPTLRPDQYVTSADAGLPPVIATMLPGTSPAGFSGADGARNWHLLVEQVRKEKIAVGSLLAETRFHAANGNSVSIACPDDFHADLFKRNRQYIATLAERLYGAKFQFETILGAMPANDGPSDAGGAPPVADRLKENPVVKALVREFGAEEIH